MAAHVMVTVWSSCRSLLLPAGVSVSVRPLKGRGSILFVDLVLRVCSVTSVQSFSHV